MLGEENQHREDQLVLLHREGRFVSVGVLVHGGAQLRVSKPSPEKTLYPRASIVLRTSCCSASLRCSCASDTDKRTQYAPSDLLVPLLLLVQTRLALRFQFERVHVVRFVLQDQSAALQGAREVVEAGEGLGFAVEHLLVARLGER